MQTIITTTLSPQELESLIQNAVKEGLVQIQPPDRKPPNNDLPIDSEEAAIFLKVSKPTLYRWVGNRQIPYHRIGKDLRFFKSELSEILKSKNKKSR